ncbi:glycoside hydrolase [Terrimonas pollutisoli]|uniref:glycoside hydrolase n=1 Tax=Terrimonas pollutisoli TaxID=3034147 RepID=UPI0023EB2992|nr:glycoside hydrolase [Terrimonas sp. H1YJ31]
MKKNKPLRIFYFTLVASFLAGLACSKKAGPPPPPNQCIVNGTDTCKNRKTSIFINLNDEKQLIHSFGASDGWTAKFIGKWADANKKTKIADYLFSMDTASDGIPKGIGLSLWRVYIGAGSFEQGANSEIPDEWRREECFLQADSSYNWNKQAGSQWFLNEAKQRGVKYTLGFAISAPVYMTLDGKAHGGGRSSFNLQSGKMPDYAEFLAEVSDHFKFDYISPFNEPQWNWGNGNASQEGSAATNTEIANLVKLLGPKLQSRSLATSIVAGEAAQWNFTTNTYDNNRGDQIYNWFSPASSNYIGNVPNTAKIISAHSYFTTCPDNNLINIRTGVVNKRNAVDAGLGLWQTEFGILGDICGQYNGYPKNISIDYGLYVAKMIHHDLAIANVSSWQWWLSMNPYNYSDGLVYVSDPSGINNPGYDANLNACKTDGIVTDSKQLWCFGNYSRFVRPGMKRIAASIEGIADDISAAGSLMISAYKDVINKKLVFVIVNMKADAKTFKLAGLGSTIKIAGNNLDVYKTTATKSLSRSVTAADNINIEAKSVTTLVGTYD